MATDEVHQSLLRFPLGQTNLEPQKWPFEKPAPALSLEGGTGWPTCGFCCPRCKKTVRDANFLHLRPQNLHVGPPFSPVGRTFLHLGPQNLHVGPPFSPVGRTVYYFTVLLFHFHTISFPLSSRQEVFACRPAIFTGRPDRYYFTA